MPVPVSTPLSPAGAPQYSWYMTPSLEIQHHDTTQVFPMGTIWSFTASVSLGIRANSVSSPPHYLDNSWRQVIPGVWYTATPLSQNPPLQKNQRSWGPVSLLLPYSIPWLWLSFSVILELTSFWEDSILFWVDIAYLENYSIWEWSLSPLVL
ncbi:hypothetical protein DSO57_1012781 [Entomophthora muscae]|uniref:Uncharacterized protein n=1 Tax=Entomophthora muscae TaxID=34485 RepID=A0ACC2TGJ5_9FUNG|nr:hypothetical protein DSO57_1012781 [Entomophthora muscae]